MQCILGQNRQSLCCKAYIYVDSVVLALLKMVAVLGVLWDAPLKLALVQKAGLEGLKRRARRDLWFLLFTPICKDNGNFSRGTGVVLFMEIGVVLRFRIGGTAGLLQTVVGDARSATVAVLHLLVSELHLKSDAVNSQSMEHLSDPHVEASNFTFRAFEVCGHFDVHGGYVPILGQLPHVHFVNAEDSRQPAHVPHCERGKGRKRKRCSEDAWDSSMKNMMLFTHGSWRRPGQADSFVAGSWWSLSPEEQLRTR